VTYVLVLTSVVHGQISPSGAASLVRVWVADVPYFSTAAAWYVVELRVQRCH